MILLEIVVVVLIVIGCSVMIGYAVNWKFLPDHWQYFFEYLFKSEDKDNTKKIETTLALHYNGVITAQLSKYCIVFSNGTEIWIKNKFYSYASLWSYNGKLINKREYKLPVCVVKKIIQLEKELSKYSLTPDSMYV